MRAPARLETAARHVESTRRRLSGRTGGMRDGSAGTDRDLVRRSGSGRETDRSGNNVVGVSSSGASDNLAGLDQARKLAHKLREDSIRYELTKILK